VFEDMTFENILETMLENVVNDVDKREGSVIYDALAPCALELAQNYYLLSNYIDLLFMDTSVDEYLGRLCLMFGLTRKEATCAVRKVTTTEPVEVGSRWGINDITFEITTLISTNVYEAQCEQAGDVGNQYSGVMDNIDNVEGVTATLTEILVYGEEEEADEQLRTRLRQKVANTTQDGNVAQYLKWANEFDGVGRAKVVPLWNGGNTVKVVITSSEYTIASDVLIEQFQEYLDPGASGLGEGVAPIGAKATVATGTEKQININASVSLNDGYTSPDGAEKQITAYLKSIVFKQSYVSYFKLGTIIGELDSVRDVKSLSINGTMQDVLLGEVDIPTLGTLSIEVV